MTKMDHDYHQQGNTVTEKINKGWLITTDFKVLLSL